MNTDTAHVDALRESLRSHGAKLITSRMTPGGYFVRRFDGSLETNHGAPLTLEEAEHWLRKFEGTLSDRESLEPLLASRRCTVIETSSPVAFYIKTPEGAIITDHGYPLTYEQTERWLDERDARDDA